MAYLGLHLVSEISGMFSARTAKGHTNVAESKRTLIYLDSPLSASRQTEKIRVRDMNMEHIGHPFVDPLASPRTAN